jgi:hypothetical protein
MFPGATDDNFMERRKRTQVGDNLRGARVRILRGLNFCRIRSAQTSSSGAYSVRLALGAPAELLCDCRRKGSDVSNGGASLDLLASSSEGCAAPCRFWTGVDNEWCSKSSSAI